jgi:hypothetical protein
VSEAEINGFGMEKLVIAFETIVSKTETIGFLGITIVFVVDIHGHPLFGSETKNGCPGFRKVATCSGIRTDTPPISSIGSSDI